MVSKFSKFSNFKISLFEEKEKKTQGGFEKTKYSGRNRKFGSKVQNKGEKFGRNERFVSSSFLFFLLF